ncbi:AMP-binding protein [Paraburkholderia diazotrophica]|uniref:1-acyl-sn-glycerol-3-phosphate acyltransferases n=1 Tax=Paraburkholderia diazotrophica TaxID=667676 RepID=A0A1H7EJN4_9BURK|nr:AMP-binding protein [Paraburkholderia diazotrophica]SEK10885.1 1-acyl-sn-glycerol-3-phosphate acyltransferases [Paraburkholderia diazotrophica]
MPLSSLQTNGGIAQRAADHRLLAIVSELAKELQGTAFEPDKVTLATRFESELGFDSLARAELLSRIEQVFGMQLPVDVFARADCISDVLRALDAIGQAETALKESSSTVEPVRQTDERAANALTAASTLCDALQWHTAHDGGRAHLILIDDSFNETRITYSDLRREALEIAGGLRATGIERGDTVALMLPTSREYFVCFLGILLCNAIPVPLYPPARLQALEEHVARNAAILNNAQAKALISFDKVATIAQLLALRVPQLRHVLVPQQIRRVPLDHVEPAHPTDVALLQYTSGSTGDPKGVTLTHANLLANIRAMGDRIGVTPHDVMISWLPLYHDMGLIGTWLAPLYYALPVVMASPLMFLARPASWLHLVDRYRGTLTAAPNFAYDRCARQLRDDELMGVNLSSLRYMFCGAEPVNQNTMRAFAARFERYGLHPGAIAPVYGLAENTLAVTFPPSGRGLHTDRVVRAAYDRQQVATEALNGDDTTEIVGCGFALDGTELRIVDSEGHELAERHIGRIEFRGTSATEGYWQNPAQTARLIDGGWLDTGDLGYIANGELFVTGRVKDMIIRGGQHFFPYELEEAIGRLSGVIHGGVAVCGGSGSSGATERLVILAETRLKDTAERENLKAKINAATIALYGAPAEQVALVPPDSILRTPGGKIRHAATLQALTSNGGVLVGRPVWRQLFALTKGSFEPLARRTMKFALRAAHGVWCYGVVAISGAWLLAVTASSRDQSRNWRQAARACRVFLRLAGIEVTLEGEVQALDTTGAIFVSNHTSYLDVVVLASVLPSPVHFVAKQELANQWLIGRLLHALGTRFVERANFSSSVSDEEELVRLATNGERLLYFPEGSFTRAPGLRAFHLGAFRAACLARRVVVPIALNGTRAALPDGDLLPHRAHVTVTACTPIEPDVADLTAMASLRDNARVSIRAHCGESDAARLGFIGTTPAAPAQTTATHT